MNQKKVFKITQTEIDLAKEEYFENGGVVTILKVKGSNPEKETGVSGKVGRTGDRS